MEGVVIPKAQPVQSVTPGAVFKDCGECPEMVVIPAGSFMMGSPAADPFQNYSETDAYKNKSQEPQHLVNIKSFAIGKYPVTQEEWFVLMGDNPSSNKGRTLPVESVSWDDAQLYVKKMSQKTGKKYRLPTEAEWEFTARAGTTTQYFWGDDIKQVIDYAWCSENSGYQTHPVGLKKQNKFGLFDILGNVWQWTQDCWNPDYSGAPTDGSAWTNGECSQKVLRGGSLISFPKDLRVANRDWFPFSSRTYSNGFRIASDL